MRVGIALGSNLGDRLANLRRAFQAVRRTAHAGDRDSILVSSVYETTPVGSEPGAGLYLNAAIEIESALPADELLDRLREVESEMGRPSMRPRNAPRTIDLDILYAGDLVLRTAKLTVPHPRLAQRAFVLTPLAEIAPALVVPGQSKSVAQLLSELRSADSAEELLKLREVLDDDG
ncbi:MAG: 2-amino-4-hydroxy-6-hydroxymethyldihydropteridine diphosphokinase [Verrucomicrobia bacterium]|nr:2-amino-4-hydroxy-6-hydroxymethyldihydropteridine diphosphokinase [Verrucomicrobiota bacterium]